MIKVKGKKIPGVAIATSYVGIVHPLSAGLSVVFGTHHCVGNCIVMRAMADHYSAYYEEFWKMTEKACIAIPKLNIPMNETSTLSKLRDYTIMHEKPLFNALGENYEEVLNFDHTSKLFGIM